MNSEQIVITGFKRIAVICGCGKTTLHKWIKQEAFPAFKKDGTWRAVPEDIKDWFKGQVKIS
ncbi:MAG: helix-turn-helix domain-containing protein [Desulfobacterales bacterium]|nr:helix-turn-helix domain-containing protein [Desulfobacterales bacterium]